MEEDTVSPLQNSDNNVSPSKPLLIQLVKLEAMKGANCQDARASLSLAFLPPNVDDELTVHLTFRFVKAAEYDDEAYRLHHEETFE